MTIKYTAVDKALSQGYRTKDIALANETVVSTEQMAMAVINHL
jgi:hypothetical protein